MEGIGERLREARRKRGLTLEELSERCGLSAGFLSQVERGRSTLSIVSLSAICHALDLPIASLFSASGPLDQKPPRVRRADDQLHIRIGGSPISYRYLTGQLPASPIEELLIAEFPPGCEEVDSVHEGEEFGYVLEGRIVLSVEDEEEALSPGDSYRIGRGERHGYKTEQEGAKVLMAVTQRFIEVTEANGKFGHKRKEAG